MRLPVLMVMLQWLGSDGICSSLRKFAVENCTACLTHDHTRGDVRMAVCKERQADTGGGTAGICECLNFPANALLAGALVYYPRVEENVTRCTNSWENSSRLNTALLIIAGVVIVYAATHLLYIVVGSGMCSKKCTKSNASALFMCMFVLSWLPLLLWRIAGQGEITIGNSGARHYAWLGHSFDIVEMFAALFFDVGQVLLCTSISDMVFGGANMAARRRCIAIFFWTLAIVTAVSVAFVTVVSRVHEDLSQINVWKFVAYAFKAVSMAVATMFMILAHRKMHAVSRHRAPPPSTYAITHTPWT